MLKSTTNRPSLGRALLGAPPGPTPFDHEHQSRHGALADKHLEQPQLVLRRASVRHTRPLRPRWSPSSRRRLGMRGVGSEPAPARFTNWPRAFADRLARPRNVARGLADMPGVAFVDVWLALRTGLGGHAAATCGSLAQASHCAPASGRALTGMERGKLGPPYCGLRSPRLGVHQTPPAKDISAFPAGAWTRGRVYSRQTSLLSWHRPPSANEECG